MSSTDKESAAKAGCWATPPRSECCCLCRYHVADHSHPGTDGGSILEQRGWVCTVFLTWPDGDDPPKVFSGWHEHGLCEMFEPR
jgi:hypothetical protein